MIKPVIEDVASTYSKTCVKRPLSKRPKIVFRYQLKLNAGQKYCRMLPLHSAILLTFIKLPFVIKIFVLSIFEWQFYTDFTVFTFSKQGFNECLDFATVHSLMKDINLIDSCQAHLPMQYAFNIKFIPQGNF